MGRRAQLELAQPWAQRQAPEPQQLVPTILVRLSWKNLKVRQLGLVLMQEPSDDHTHRRTVHSVQGEFDRSGTASAVVSQRFRLRARFYPANFTDLASLTAALEATQK